MDENRTGLATWAMSAALLLATSSGCGDETTTTHHVKTPAPQSGADAGAGGDDTDDTELPRQLDIEISVAGTDAPIMGTVSERGGLIHVGSYPERLVLPISYGLLTVPFDGAFEDEFCQSVQELTELEPPEAALDLVRHDGAVTARLPLSSLVWPETAAEANRSAGALGVNSGVFFENPLVIDTLELSLELSDSAISRALGTEDLLAELNRALERQGSGARETGVLQLSLGSKDLWCDLAHREATIRVRVVGTFGEEPYEGETVVEGVEPL